MCGLNRDWDDGDNPLMVLKIETVWIESDRKTGGLPGGCLVPVGGTAACWQSALKTGGGCFDKKKQSRVVLEHKIRK